MVDPYRGKRSGTGGLLITGGVAAALIAGFLVGRAYERRYWSIASPAKRAMWRAKEGSFSERIRAANAAIERDPEYLWAYYYKARAFMEGTDHSPADLQREIAVLDEGLERSGANDVLELLAQARAELAHHPQQEPRPRVP